MSRYQELSKQYADICEKNLAYRKQIMELANKLKTGLAGYLGCEATMLHYVNFAEGSKLCELEESLFFDEESVRWIFGLSVELHIEQQGEYPILELLLPFSVYKNKELLLVDIGKNIFVLDAEDRMLEIYEKIMVLLKTMLENLLKEQRKEHKPLIGFVRELSRSKTSVSVSGE